MLSIYICFFFFQPVANADFVVPVEIDNIIHQVYVLKRPFCDEFLKRMGEMFECILFTASLSKVSCVCACVCVCVHVCLCVCICACVCVCVCHSKTCSYQLFFCKFPGHQRYSLNHRLNSHSYLDASFSCCCFLVCLCVCLFH